MRPGPKLAPLRANAIEEIYALIEVRDEVIATLKRGGVIALDQTSPTTTELLALLRRMRGTDA